MARRTSSVLVVSVAGMIFLLARFWSSGTIALPQTSNASAESACSTTLVRAAPSDALCYWSQVPAQVLNSAPFNVFDPRQIVTSVAGLPLGGIYVARLGSEDSNVGHPLGPLMVVEYLFEGVPLPANFPRIRRTYVRVLEAGYMWPGWGRLVSAQGVINDQLAFNTQRMDLGVTTNLPRSWERTLVRRISHAIRSVPPRPVPSLRLYVHPPGLQMRVHSKVSFFVLNNTSAARKLAAFELVLRGRWSVPQVFAPYGGQACGGDNVPSLLRRRSSLWTLNFGDCREVGLVLSPIQPGPYSLAIRTYQSPIGSKGLPITDQRHLVPNGGFVWHATAHR